MSVFLSCITLLILVSSASFNAGKFYGAKEAREETRTQVVFYCNERPAECQKEYNTRKFQFPELVVKKIKE